MRIVQPNDEHEKQETFTLKVAAVGHSGAGKTTWMASSPRPLYCLTRAEQKDAAIVRRINPNATIVMVDSWPEFCELWDAVKLSSEDEVEGPDGQMQPARIAHLNGQELVFQTFVGDGFTELQSMAIANKLGVKHEDMNVLDFNQKTKTLDMRDWGSVLGACEQVWRESSTLPCNVVWSFLATTRFVSDATNTERPYLLPTLSGQKLPFQLSRYFNAGGFFTTRRGANGVEHVVRWSMPGSTFAKGLHGWPECTASSGVDRHGRLLDAGRTTLGSLLLYSADGAPCAWAEGDDASHVEAQVGESMDGLEDVEAMPAPGAPPSKNDNDNGGRRRRRG